MINEVFDRIMLDWRLPHTNDYATYQVGIYSACYRLSLLITVFVQAFICMSRGQAKYGFHFAESLFEQVSPVGNHVEDDSTAVLLAGVPRGTLPFLPITLENIIAVIPADC